MNKPFEMNDRRMPYEVSGEAFEALRVRIGRRLDAAERSQPGIGPAVEMEARGVPAGVRIRQGAAEERTRRGVARVWIRRGAAEERTGWLTVRQRLWRWGVVAAGVAVVVAGLVTIIRWHRPAERQLPDLDRLLTTASAETLQQAAAENYDDIFFNQQL